MDYGREDYVVTDELYDLAYKFYDQKPWNYVSEENTFAVKASDGKILYVQLIGNHSPFDKGICVFVGEEDLRSIKQYYELPNDVPFHTLSELSSAAQGIHLTFRMKDFYEEDSFVIEPVKEYLERIGSSRLNEDSRIPHFLDKLSYRVNYSFSYDYEKVPYLIQGIEALLSLSKLVKTGHLELPDGYFDFGYLLENTKAGYRPVEVIEYPKADAFLDECYYAKVNEEDIKWAKELPLEGEVEVELTIEPKARPKTDEETGEEIYLYNKCVTVCNLTDETSMLSVSILTDFKKDDSSDLVNVTEALTNNQARPEKIYVQSKRTASYIQDLADKLGSKVIIKEKIHMTNIILKMQLGQQNIDSYSSLF